MKQITNQQKKELFQVLIPYFESKPEERWITHYRWRGDKHCALGFLDEDFKSRYSKDNFIKQLGYEFVDVTGMVVLATFDNDYRYGIVKANNGHTYEHLPTPKQRVLAYLNDQINNL